jgi:hypothetical protein
MPRQAFDVLSVPRFHSRLPQLSSHPRTTMAGKIDGWIKLNGPNSLYIMDDTISLADVWMVSYLKFPQVIEGELNI